MSFEDSGVHELSPGMNIVVGQNNSGKTALLKCIAMRVGTAPHRNSSFPTTHVYNPQSIVEYQFVVSGDELRSFLLKTGSLRVPIAKEWINNNQAPDFSIQQMLLAEEIVFRVNLRGDGGWEQLVYPSHQLFVESKTFSRTWVAIVTNQEKTGFSGSNISQGSEDDIGGAMGQEMRNQIYFFDAQRLNIGHSPFGSNSALASNASNLAEVLNIMQDNRYRFDTLIDHLREVFPTIKSVSVRPGQHTINGQVEIRIWNTDPKKQRGDLAIPLDECGTGVGQVIAILYVILSANAHTIVIDEPNSFLHPAASRQLIKILRKYRSHQYVISTHSPETLSAADPDQLFVVRFKDERSLISSLRRDRVQNVQEALTEVGSRLSDVFGSDAIVWVEGQTEEACFPLIMAAAGVRLGNAVSVVALRNTGDLESRKADAKAIWDVYQQLSKANSLMPRALAFSLDRERRTDADVAELTRLSKGLTKFLPRKMLENYFVHPAAITALLNRFPSFRERPTTEEVVEQWIIRNGGIPKYFKGTQILAVDDDDWMKEVHAANLISDLFSDLSEAKETYHKIAHGKELTRWIIDHDNSHFCELYKYVLTLVPKEIQLL